MDGLGGGREGDLGKGLYFCFDLVLVFGFFVLMPLQNVHTHTNTNIHKHTDLSHRRKTNSNKNDCFFL